MIGLARFPFSRLGFIVVGLALHFFAGAARNPLVSEGNYYCGCWAHATFIIFSSPQLELAMLTGVGHLSNKPSRRERNSL